MFKQRLMTSLILIPVVFLFIYFANNWCLNSVCGLMVIGCAYEWQQLIPITDMAMHYFFMGILVILLLLSYYIVYQLIFCSLLLWSVIIVAIFMYPRSQPFWGKPVVVLNCAFILLLSFFQSMMHIAIIDRSLLVYLLLLVWSADIGAYIAGKLCGKHKLISAISPGKTIEGIIGGNILIMIIAALGYIYFQYTTLGSWLLMAEVIYFISVIGDLFISMLKRRVNIKDTGNLLPGHGGVLDRLDSLIAAAPVFYLCLGIH